MKRTHILSATMAFAILAPATFFSSCQQRELELPESKTGSDIVFRARIEDPLTRTVLSGNDATGYDVVWESGDQIVVTDAGGRVGTFTTTDSGTTEAGFTLVSGAEEKTAPFRAWSPASIYNDGAPALPTSQTYLAGNRSGAPMFAENDTEDLTFKNICGIIRLNIGTELADQRIARITLSADQGLSGAITNAASLASSNYVATVAAGGNLQLDCGSEGVAIGQTPTPFCLSVPANTYTGLTITAVTVLGVKQTWTLKEDRSVVVGRSLITDISLSFTRELVAVDLSAKATANTYIVSEAGTYKFKATVKGNGGLDPMTGEPATALNAADIAGVKVLWELDSQGRAIYHDGTGYDCFYAGGYVYFNTPETFATGVACVAVYDSSDNILWSWNIWSTPAPQTMVYNGKVFMDRNLCAVDLNGNRGFLYQWGRKDAFSAATGGYSSFTFVPALSTAFNTVTGIQTMAYAIAHPTTHVNNGDSNSWMSQTEYEKQPWRDDVKTIYDPSPAGWRVPTSDEQNGMSGLPATGFSNAINEFGNPNSGYYRTSTATSYPKAYAYRQSGERNNWGTNPAFAIRCVEDDSAPIDLSEFTDLSETAPANSYVVPAAGTYKFRADVKGNGAASLAGVNKDTDVSAIASADLVWASYGTSTAPAATEMIRKIGYQDGYVFFSTGLNGFREGNAVVAVKDANGTILWSWHLWFTDDDLEGSAQTYPGGAVFMDRNLGALDDDTAPDNYGLLYQWGRKDPFVNTYYTGITGDRTYPAAMLGTEVRYADNTKTVAEVAQYPNYYLYSSSHVINGQNTSEWAADMSANLWGEDKTIFDPCPVGWKVPASALFDRDYRESFFGYEPVNEIFYLDNVPVHLPVTGIRFRISDGWSYNGRMYYRIYGGGVVEKPMDYFVGIWTADGTYTRSNMNGIDENYTGFFTYDNLSSVGKNAELYPIFLASGHSVRCVRESSEVVLPTSISIPSSATVASCEATRLTVTTTPANCGYYEASWSSSDTYVARVDGYGNVVGVSPGTCTITLSSSYGNASCTVTVTAADATLKAVDMGLPSGTLWANMNAGASSPGNTGTTTNWYGSQEVIQNVYGNDTPWMVPTKVQCEELIAHCAFLSMPSGVIAVSKINGNSLYFPDGGCWCSDRYIASSQYYLEYLSVYSGGPSLRMSATPSSGSRYYPVRAVQ